MYFKNKSWITKGLNKIEHMLEQINIYAAICTRVAKHKTHDSMLPDIYCENFDFPNYTCKIPT